MTDSNALDFTLSNQNLVKFSNVSTVDALGGTDTVMGQVNQTWTLKGNEHLSDGNIDFEHIEVAQVVSGNASIDAGNTSGSGTDAFTVFGSGAVNAQGINFFSVNSVTLDTTDTVTDDNTGTYAYELESDSAMTVLGISFSSGAFGNFNWGTNDTLALADGHTVSGTVAASGAQLLGSDSSDTFTIVGAGDINYKRATIGNTVSFTGVAGVQGSSSDAIGDSDILMGQVNQTWTLKGNEHLSDGNIDFEHIEVAQVV
ncbi:hypothetical protein, partial [Paraglaciecola psychrophila]|uniref:hypothetical protein n=1 Tax=Paraglaciecola psychrophila TaxID=326544 RepID=UPI00129A313F